jgi:hypothetical protein
MKLNIFFSITIFLFLSQFALSQESVQVNQKPSIYNGQFQSLSQDNIGSISSFQFEGKFAAHLVTDDHSNFFLLDLSLLNGEFEKEYFMKEIYKKQLFIQHGHGMPVGKAWVIVDTKILPENIIIMLNNLLANVKLVSSGMSESDKNSWLISRTN